MIDSYVASWTTPEGFRTLFYRMCGEYSTQEKAYEAAERLYKAQYGVNRYADFESFRQVKNKVLKNGRKKRNFVT
jgi:hypothetical protein